MEFGKTLREAREAKGYTLSQLAEITHIMSRTIEGLEAEDFSSIPAPIYGRGFVKLCCQHLGLDQKAMVDEFMAIYNGEKPAVKPAAVAAEPKAEPLPEPSVAEKPVAVEPPPPQNFGELFNQPAEPLPPKNAPSRFAPPKPQEERRYHPDLELPQIPWRLVMLIVGAIALLWIAIAGCRAIYGALSEPAGDAKPVHVEKDASGSAERGMDSRAQGRPARTAKPVKPLYID